MESYQIQKIEIISYILSGHNAIKQESIARKTTVTTQIYGDRKIYSSMTSESLKKSWKKFKNSYHQMKMKV